MKRRLTLLLPIAIAACASPARREQQQQQQPPTEAVATAPKGAVQDLAAEKSADLALSRNSSIDIEYQRGRNDHHFIVQSIEGTVTLRMLLDGKVLREGHLEATKYAALLARVREFVDQASRTPATASADCRIPYEIRLKTPEATRTVRGCKTDCSAAPLGKLIHEAEFLLYRQ